jgi:CheY-like chemotaxis protein
MEIVIVNFLLLLDKNIMIILTNSNIVYRITNREVCLLSTKKNNKRIMIIDDDKDITDLFSIFLEYNGYIVNAYTNPVEAFNNFRKNSHDLIILDLKMPKIDGMILYHKIKEIDDKVIICFTTANIAIFKICAKALLILIKLFYTNQYY